MKTNKKIIIILLLLIIGIVWLTHTIPIIHNVNKKNCSIKMNTSESVIRGTVIVYTIENIDNTIKLEEITAKIINYKGKIIGDAVIKENRILIDTSPLERGTYKIMLQYQSSQMLVEQSFYVDLI